MADSLKRKDALIGEWTKHRRTDGSFWIERSVDGFLAMMIQPTDDGTGWLATYTDDDEVEFPSREEAESYCIARAIEYVQGFQDHCAAVLAALNSLKPRDSAANNG